MIRFSKIWCGFTAVAVILIFTAGSMELSAQTTKDSAIDKDKSSNDTTKGRKPPKVV